MSNVRIRKPPLFQFSLRTLLFVFVIVALLLGYLTTPIRIGLRRVEVQKELRALGATVKTESIDLGWAGAFLPDEASEQITEVLFLEEEPTDDDLALLRDCPQIRKLHIDGSKFTDAGFRHVEALKELRTLVVFDDANQLGDDSLECLEKLQRLKTLWLGSSSITGRGLTELDCLPRLTVLGLPGCQMSDETLASLGSLENLQMLFLEDVLITDQGLEHLKQFPKLDHLSLSGTKMSDEGLIVVGSLTGLKQLDLGCMGITDEGIQHLRQLRDLEYLDLCNTKITDACLPHLLSLTNLRTLVLWDTAITKEAAGQLRALPRLRTLIYDRKGSKKPRQNSTDVVSEE